MVKKNFLLLAVIGILILLAVFPPAMAQTADSGDIKVILNGAEILFDTAPVICDGRTMVPMRAVFEALGMEVDWAEDTQTVTATNKDVTLTLAIGEPTVLKETAEGEEVIPMDVVPAIKDGRTLVPIRFIAESTGCYVGWDEKTKTVIAVSPSLPQNVGRLYYEDGETLLYLGEIKNSLPCGKGTYFYEDGSVLCIGEFKDGEMNGLCTVYGIEFAESGNYKDGTLVSE